MLLLLELILRVITRRFTCCQLPLTAWSHPRRCLRDLTWQSGGGDVLHIGVDPIQIRPRGGDTGRLKTSRRQGGNGE